MRARLTRSVPEKRITLISGEGKGQPVVGDIGETDHCFTGPDGRQMVLVYFLSSDGRSEWEVEAYESELEPVVE